MEQRFISRKISSYPQSMVARVRSMPSNTPQMYYSSSTTNSMGIDFDKTIISSPSYHPSLTSNSYIPAQQLTPISHEYPTFMSPLSNPSTPYQTEFNSNTEFGVPYHHGQPSSVNSLTDALCPSEISIDRQLTPGPPVRSLMLFTLEISRFIIECGHTTCWTISIFISSNSFHSE